MDRIKILGLGCVNCWRLGPVTRRVGQLLNIPVEIEKVTNSAEIIKYPILTTPGLVINGKWAPSRANLESGLKSPGGCRAKGMMGRAVPCGYFFLRSLYANY